MQMSMPVEIDYRALAAWAVGLGSLGISSGTMAAALAELPAPFRTGYPHDAGDLSRCFDLLRAVPSLRPRLPMLASMGPVWSAILVRWEELEALYAAAPMYWGGSKAAQQYRTTVYDLIAKAEEAKSN